MKKIIVIVLCSFCFVSTSFARHIENMEKLFYLATDDPHSAFSGEQLQEISDHAKSIDIIAPQIYQLHDNGAITGTLDSKLLALTRMKNIKLMPLLTNFNQMKFHLLLHNVFAEEKAIANMLALCEEYHLVGLQFDFENIHVSDKEEYTRFFQSTAKQLHQHGFLISVAVVPITDSPSSDYDRWYYDNWSGAYDYQALGQSSDFITIMSYDRHTTLTTPGPLAPIDWVEKTIQVLLKGVPANKISLGIPVYSGYWLTGKVGPSSMEERFLFRSREIPMSYKTAVNLLKQFHQSLIWQNQWKSSYVLFSHRDRNEYLFVENAKSFRAKLALAKRYQLRGISVWKLGLEDPAIWIK